MTDKIGGHETVWHDVKENGAIIKDPYGHTVGRPYETVKIKGVEFIIIGASGRPSDDYQTAVDALEYTQRYARPGIKIVKHSNGEGFAIVSPSSDIVSVYNDINKAYANGKGEPAYGNIDEVVDRFIQQSAGRVNGTTENKLEKS